MDTRTSLAIWIRDRMARVPVSATESFQPLRLGFSQTPAEKRGTWRQGGGESGRHCRSVCICLSVCLDTVLCLPLCPCLLSLSDGRQLLPMSSAFGLSLYICSSLSILLTTIFCFLPSPMSLINRLLCGVP